MNECKKEVTQLWGNEGSMQLVKDHYGIENIIWFGLVWFDDRDIKIGSFVLFGFRL